MKKGKKSIGKMAFAPCGAFLNTIFLSGNENPYNVKATVFNQEKFYNSSRFIFYLFLAAFALRIGFFAVMRDYPLLYIQSLDEKYYVDLGKIIASGSLRGEQGAFFMDPMYGYFLGFIFFVFGDNLTIVRLIQILLDAFNVVLIFAIGRRVWDQWAGIVAAIIWAAYIVSFYYTLLMLKVTLAITGLLVFMLLLLVVIKNQRKTSWFLTGMGAGILNFISANFILMIPLTLVFYCFIERPKWRSFIINSAFVLAGAMTLLSINGIRNYFVAGHPVFLNTSSGLILYSSNNPGNTSGLFDVPAFAQSHPVSCQDDFLKEAERRTSRSLSPKEASIFWRNATFRVLKDNLQIIPVLILNKLKWTFANYEITMNQPYQFVANFAGTNKWPFPNYAFVLAFGLPGLAIGISRRKQVGWLLVPVLVILATLMIFYVCTRFRMPMVPFLVIGTGICLRIAFVWVKEGNWRKIILLGLVSSTIFLVSMSISPPSGDGYKEFVLAKAIYSQNHHDKAEAYAVNALKKYPDNLDLHILLGRIATKKGLINESIMYYQGAMKITPDNFTVNYDLAMIHMDSGKPELAIPYFEKCLTLNHHIQSMFHLARAYEACGNNRQAIKYYREFLESASPDDPGREYAKKRLAVIR
jgi:tetratricopeptide (TPR) repeat protein